ncbi:hypothetical protein ACLPJK_26355 [Pseudomonas aeruginosa]|uniref:hypothetical protein n=1 Tax=Pseudomonas aeruginosa TaxID=287 RepID=UPI003D2B849D
MLDNTDSLAGGGYSAVQVGDALLPVYETPLEGGGLAVSETPRDTELVVAEESLNALGRILADVSRTGFIHRARMNEVAINAVGLESFAQFTANYPINSFTSAPSTQNVSVAMEGIVSSITELSIKIIRKVIAFIIDLLKKIYAFLANCVTSFKKYLTKAPIMADLKDKLDAIRQNAAELDDDHFAKALHIAKGEYEKEVYAKFQANWTQGLEWLYGYSDREPYIHDLLLATAEQADSSSAAMLENLDALDKSLNWYYDRAKSSDYLSDDEFITQARAYAGELMGLNYQQNMRVSDVLLDYIGNIKHSKVARVPKGAPMYFRNAAAVFAENMREIRNTKVGKPPVEVIESSSTITAQAKEINDNSLPLIETIKARIAKASEGMKQADKVIMSTINDQYVVNELLGAYTTVMNDMEAVILGAQDYLRAFRVQISIYTDALLLERARLICECNVYVQVLRDKNLSERARKQVQGWLVTLRSNINALRSIG